MIRASAGSGKTHQLCLRMLRLLLAGVDPSKIVALTFTRKAAGEFLSKLLVMLAQGATDANRAAEYADQSHASTDGHGHIGCDAFLASLERVVTNLGTLRLCTLDSFFSLILRAFPFEFGLPGDFELIDGDEAVREQEKVLRLLFAQTGERRRNFQQAFAEATAGGMAKEAYAGVARCIEAYHATYLLAPDASKWGSEQAIWGTNGCPWPQQISVKSQADLIQSAMDTLVFHNTKARQRLEAFLDTLQNWSPRASLPPEIAYIFKSTLKNLKDLEQGSGCVTLERKPVQVQGQAASALATLTSGWLGCEIHQKLRATRGLHSILSEYERLYHQTTRSRGRLVFADLPLLLTGQSSDDGIARMDVDYRLDASFDHWLIDEFQDTSRLQWKVISNLIDEVVQDSEGRRSFFYVGDVKQSIYSWRGGDPKLFDDVFIRYGGKSENGIQEKLLDESWRSCPEVIEMVNAVFDPDTVIKNRFPEAADRWRSAWSPHSSAPPRRREHGYAALVDPKNADDDDSTSGNEAAIATMVEIITNIQPLERGLTCAVIVSKNDFAEQCVHALRRAGIPALRDGEVAVGDDNPLSRAIVRLLDLASHPGNVFAREFLEWGPLGTARRSGKLPCGSTWEQVAESVRRSVESHGFRACLGGWFTHFLDPDKADPFTRQRMDAILRLAAEADRHGIRAITEFRRKLANAVASEAGGHYAIQVMTIHKSKGLGFDVVILPELDQGRSLTTPRAGLRIKTNPHNNPEWVLDLPRTEVAEADTILAHALAEAREEACFESLCTLYVALTRAKRAVYAIARSPEKGSTAKTYATWLYAALPGQQADTPHPTPTSSLTTATVHWSTGQADWFLSTPFTEATAASTEQTGLPVLPPPPSASPATRPAPADLPEQAPPPSAHPAGYAATGAILEANHHLAMQLGSHIHARLAAIPWPGNMTPSDANAIFSGNDPVSRLITKALANEDVRKALSRPAPDAHVLIEQPFEVFLNGSRVSGIMDRLVIIKEHGHIHKAIVQDYKTDAIEPTPADIQAAIARHRNQLLAYRAAAAALLNLTPQAVSCQLLFLSAPCAAMLDELPP